MKPYKLLTKDETPKLPPSIVVMDNKNDVLATIWADQRITPAQEQHFDYEYDEIKYFLYIADNFWTLFRNLRDKDAEIERLKDELQAESAPTLTRQVINKLMKQ